MEETKAIYYIEEDKGDKVPYLIKLNVAPDNACLRDFKKVLNSTRLYKYFFQTVVDDIGVVKQEISDDDARLPLVNDRLICWLVPVEEANISGGTGSGCENDKNRLSSELLVVREDGPSTQQQHKPINTPLKDLNFDETSTDTESLANEFNDLKMMQQHNKAKSKRQHHFGSFNNHQQHHNNHNSHKGPLVQRGGSLGHHHHYYHHHNSHHHHHPYHKPTTTTTTMTAAGGPPSSKANIQNNNHMPPPTVPTYRSNKLAQFDSVSMLSATSSERDTTTFFDSQTEYDDGRDEADDDSDDDDENDDHFSSISGSTATTTTTMLSKREKRRRTHKHMNRYMPVPPTRSAGNNFINRHNSLQSSMSSLADSTMSLNIITVKLNLDTANFLGLSIVGQSNKKGEGGIYVGSVMRGGAVELDGRIEPGDMILQVNDISFEHMSNDDAVRVLREAVKNPGPLKLVVAKCWEPHPKGYFQVSKQDPVYPINPSAWIAHTQAALDNKGGGENGATLPAHQQRGMFNHRHLNHSVSSFGGSTASFSTTFADSTITSVNVFGPPGTAAATNNYQHYHQFNNNNNKQQQQQQNPYGGVVNHPTVLTTDSTRFGCTQELNLTAESDMDLIVRALAAADSGLDVRERNWLKITIPGAFIGSDVVDWLFHNVEGFPERRDARKYASMMLKQGYIRHAVNRMHFSERSYYVFGDQASTFLTTQNGTQAGMAGGTLFTVDEENSGDIDSVSEFGGGDRDSVVSNYAAPLNFPVNVQPSLPPVAPPPQTSRPIATSQHHQHQHQQQQPPGLTFGQPSSNIYSHQPKIYSNVLSGGIGGPVAIDHVTTTAMSGGGGGGGSGSSGGSNTQSSNYHHSSSSSNVTSNSTSTTSQNTTTATSTSTSGLGKSSYSNVAPPPPNSFLSQHSHSRRARKSGGAVITSDRPNSSCQLYYPTPVAVDGNKTELSINETITTQSSTNANQPPQNSFMSQFNASNNNTTTLNIFSSGAANGHKSGGSGSGSGGGGDNRSVKSSENSSSGTASDQELLSSRSGRGGSGGGGNGGGSSKCKKPDQQMYAPSSHSNYYDLNKIKSSISSSKLGHVQTATTNGPPPPRGIDKVPKEVHVSKQSFCQAMENPCEFFVDVM